MTIINPIYRMVLFLNLCLLFLLFFLMPPLNAQNVKTNAQLPSRQELEERILHWMKEGKIPGLILVVTGVYNKEYIKGFGYKNLETQSALTPGTLFELASCSMSFTALAALNLEKEGSINLDAYISDYFPWFYVTHDQKKYHITPGQLLHHTSGIPDKTLSFISPGNNENALEQILHKVSGIELNSIPGERFRYNPINYDIIGAIIEKVTGKSFEAYMKNNIFAALGLTSTFVGVRGDWEIPLLASGYKRGFFQPRKYVPPVFRGNNPAAYIISNGKDIARWLCIHLGLIETKFDTLIQKSRQPNFAVPPTRDLTSYAMGWYVNPYKNNEVFHSGLNPNFSCYIGFRPREKLGVAILVNCNSTFTRFIGHSVMSLIAGEKISSRYPPGDKVDGICSFGSLALGLYILLVFSLTLVRIIGISQGKFTTEPFTGNKAKKLAMALVVSIPFLYGIYLLPYVAVSLPWEVALVWAPTSFKVSMLLLLCAIGCSYILFVFSLILPPRKKYRGEIPLIAITSTISGLARTAVIFIVTTAFFSTVGLWYLFYYFGLVYLLNVGGRKIAQTKMITVSNHIVLALRTGLINKVLSSPYQKFERIQDGRIFSTLNDDTTVLSRSAASTIAFVTSFVTLISGFIYMTTISFSSTLVVVAVTIVLGFYYRILGKTTRIYMEKARDALNEYISLLSSMIQGYKELSIHRRKKYEFKQDVIHSSQVICSKNISAGIKFLNGQLIGDSIGLIVLGILSIVISRVITDVNLAILISFVMILLYLLEHIRIIINLLPAFIQFKVSWDRIKNFIKVLEVKEAQQAVKEFINHIDLVEKQETIDLSVLDHLDNNVENLKVENLMFQYESKNGDQGFSIGPIDFDLNKGEILFITGGNGSGKTTIAKLITGLYYCDKGNIKINNVPVDNTQIGEYFSTIYSNYHLFPKIYGTNLNDKESEIQNHLRLLNLEEKIQLKNGIFSTLDLSGGQKKRLALLQCWLEDNPIYLFDEVAADQDPEFRKFFYHDLLIKMKEKGKIIIAITHDDHYFDVADKIIKMDMGKIDMYKNRPIKTT